MSPKTIGYALLICVGLVAPFMIYPIMIMKVLCFALFACAFNLLLGYTGLLSFGHAVFLGTAGYTAGHAIKMWGLTPELGILIGVAAAATLGFFFGALAIRRAGIYFAMITLALAQMMYFVFLQARFTGGEDGLQGVPRGKLFGVVDLRSDLNMYYVVLALFVFGFWVINRAVNSPFGEVLKAIRENETRATSLGYDVNRYKLLAFVLSAGLAGLAGATKTVVFRFSTLTDAHWHTSGEVVLMTLLGGMGTALGPVIGASVIVVLQNMLADKVGSMLTVIMGVIFVVCVLLFRRGIAGELAALYQKRKSSRTSLLGPGDSPSPAAKASKQDAFSAQAP
jgi:branched-chain amino acid transport system permease protein